MLFGATASVRLVDCAKIWRFRKFLYTTTPHREYHTYKSPCVDLHQHIQETIEMYMCLCQNGIVSLGETHG